MPGYLRWGAGFAGRTGTEGVAQTTHSDGVVRLSTMRKTRNGSGFEHGTLRGSCKRAEFGHFVPY